MSPPPLRSTKYVIVFTNSGTKPQATAPFLDSTRLGSQKIVGAYGDRVAPAFGFLKRAVRNAAVYVGVKDGGSVVVIGAACFQLVLAATFEVDGVGVYHSHRLRKALHGFPHVARKTKGTPFGGALANVSLAGNGHPFGAAITEYYVHPRRLIFKSERARANGPGSHFISLARTWLKSDLGKSGIWPRNCEKRLGATVEI